MFNNCTACAVMVFQKGDNCEAQHLIWEHTHFIRGLVLMFLVIITTPRPHTVIGGSQIANGVASSMSQSVHKGYHRL